ncbi:MAG TPA: RICIN domain-containing protein [Verrucomicrobiae bacterium]|jgi:signal transduction histidine kinase|nr:RICIN domain-containing protein [Verrucomicrobiae bacterium]
MNVSFHKSISARQLLCKAMVMLVLFSSAWAGADTVKGLYVGSDFYAPNEASQNAARISGFTRIFLSFFHIDDRGDITYNNTPVIRNGVYVGDPSWATKLAYLKKLPTTVGRIELALGGEPREGGGHEAGSFANIRSLVAAQGTGSTSILYKDFVALKEATGAEAVQLADEDAYDLPSATALGKMVAALGMKVTFCAYTNQDFWAQARQQLGTNVDAIYVRCYGEGSGNDPASWAKTFGGSAIIPGLWGNVDTPTSAMLKMRAWRQAPGIAGGFMWLNGFMPEDAIKWSGALSYGLDSIAALRIVNKNSGKSLDLLAGGMTNGSAIGQSAYEAEEDQRWMVLPTEHRDHFKLISWKSGKCASVAFDSSLPGAQLWAWDYNNDSSQQFDLIDAGNGWFEIKNVRSKLVLEVAGGSTADAAVVQQNVDTTAANQLWRLYPYQPALLAFDNFDYPAGGLGGQNGGDGWNGGWFDAPYNGTGVSEDSLLGGTNVPVGYDARSSGNSAYLPNDKRVGRYLDCSASGMFGAYGFLDRDGRIGADGKTLYVSFLEQPAKTSLFYEFELNNGTERIAGLGNDTHTDNVNLRAPAHSFTTIGSGNTNVNFYVMRIDFHSGNDDVRVYRNPTSDTEPEEPALILPDGADMSFNRVSLAAFANGNTARFDQIRIASSWQYAIAAAPEYSIRSSSNILTGDIFNRVRVSGQILGGGADGYYLLDGDTGLRVSLSRANRFEPGDVVVVAGLVERRGQIVDLIEAEARKTGHSPLPPPQPLELADSAHAGLWVTVEGILTGFKENGIESTMDLQVGSRQLKARIKPPSKTQFDWPIGSRLRLSGIYIRDPAESANEDAIELLLNSPDAVAVITRPPWWTLKRAMFAIGLLISGLALAFIWIRSLQRQVDLQTVRLRTEITQRERAERGRFIEEERSRISRDLHDDLGSILTQINMLTHFTPGIMASPDLMRERIHQISEKSHRMISALDEVVWMMNSRNESLSSLAAYVAAYAEDFLSKTNIVCRIEVPRSYPEKAVSADVRNNVFSSVKEAINNLVRHGKPGKVLLKISVLEDHLEIHIHDDGCGFDPQNVEQGNGLANLQHRMQRIGGTCEIQSSPLGGTTVILQLPIGPLA